jgi:Ca2+-binding EF-hand superfamily protein
MTHSRIMIALATLALAAGCSRSNAPASREKGPEMTPAAGPARETTEPGSPAPARPRCRENFAAFDDDGNGFVSRDEFGARPHAHTDPAALFRDRDTNGDDKLTESEFCSGWRPGTAVRPGVRETQSPSGAGRGAGGMRRQRAAGPMMTMGCEQNFETFDADRDGKLTASELAAWPHARGDAQSLFEARDADGDGTLTVREFCAKWR